MQIQAPTLGDQVAPPDVLEALRAIDPAAQLVHVGKDSWWLGVMGENREAEARLQAEIQSTVRSIADSASDPLVAREEQKRLRMLLFMSSGFRPIALYRTTNLNEIVKDFRIRDFNFRNREREAHREFRDGVSTSSRDAWRNQLMREFASQEAGGWHRKFMRRAVSAVVGALPWTRST